MRRGIATEARISKTVTVAAAIVTELVDAQAVGELVALAVIVDAHGIRSVRRSVGPPGRWRWTGLGRGGSGRSIRPAVVAAIGCPDRRVMGDAGGRRRTAGTMPADRATDGRAGTTPAAAERARTPAASDHGASEVPAGLGAFGMADRPASSSRSGPPGPAGGLIVP
jgi:hypothetical protein